MATNNKDYGKKAEKELAASRPMEELKAAKPQDELPEHQEPLELNEHHEAPKAAAAAPIAAEPVAEEMEEEHGGGFASWLPWVLLLAACLIGIYFLWTRDTDTTADQVSNDEYVEEVESVQVVDFQSQLNAATDSLSDVHFAVGSSEITPEGQKMLDNVASIMKANPGIKVDVIGHASADGDAAKNLTLSENRAKAAISYLVNKCGISSDRLSAKADGESDPVSTTAAGNRCVDFIVAK